MNTQLIDTQVADTQRHKDSNPSTDAESGIGATLLRSTNDPTETRSSARMQQICAVIQGIDSPALAAASTLQDLSGRLRDRSLTPAQCGVLGEEYAAAWLARRGWTTLSRNWHTRYGELDLVMLDPKRIVVFVEVKTRRSIRYGSPQEAVTSRKRLRLRRAGVQWLLEPEHRIAHHGVRFDVISILREASGPAVTYIPEAF
jgi:putative endonuclease